MEVEQSATAELNDNAAESSDNEQGSAPESNSLVYDGQKLSEKLAKNPNLLDEQAEIPDLEKLSRFKFNGKLLSAAELKNMVLQQSDYTRKTRELADEKKHFESQKRFHDNLIYDLEKLENNPALISEFLKVYPKEFHKFAERVGNSQKQATEQSKLGTQAGKDDGQSKILSQVEQLLEQKYGQKLSKLESDYETRNFEAAKLEIDSVFDKMLQKYPLSPAYESWVAQKLIASRDQWREENPGEAPPKPDLKVMEELFKSAHSEYQKDFGSYQSKIVSGQKAANERGKGPGAGGGTPGQAPRVPKTIREASEMALSDPLFQ